MSNLTSAINVQNDSETKSLTRRNGIMSGKIETPSYTSREELKKALLEDE